MGGTRMICVFESEHGTIDRLDKNENNGYLAGWSVGYASEFLYTYKDTVGDHYHYKTEKKTSVVATFEHYATPSYTPKHQVVPWPWSSIFLQQLSYSRLY